MQTRHSLLFLLATATRARAQVDLGTAQAFAVLGSSTVTNTGSSVIQGDVGLWPGTSITGFPPGSVVDGTTHATDEVAEQAHANAQTAYDEAVAQSPSADLTGQDLGGMVLVPGVYAFSAGAGLTGQLTLDGQGSNDSVWIFQIGEALTTASASQVVLENSALACNVLWQVASSATLGGSTSFVGSILAGVSITLVTAASVDGGLYALGGAVTLDTNDVDVSDCAVSLLPSSGSSASSTATSTATSTTTSSLTATSTSTTTSTSMTTTSSPTSDSSTVSSSSSSSPPSSSATMSSASSSTLPPTTSSALSPSSSASKSSFLSSLSSSSPLSSSSSASSSSSIPTSSSSITSSNSIPSSSSSRPSSSSFPSSTSATYSSSYLSNASASLSTSHITTSLLSTQASSLFFANRLSSTTASSWGNATTTLPSSRTRPIYSTNGTASASGTGTGVHQSSTNLSHKSTAAISAPTTITQTTVVIFTVTCSTAPTTIETYSQTFVVETPCTTVLTATVVTVTVLCITPQTTTTTPCTTTTTSCSSQTSTTEAAGTTTSCSGQTSTTVTTPCTTTHPVSSEGGKSTAAAPSASSPTTSGFLEVATAAAPKRTGAAISATVALFLISILMGVL